MYVCELVGSELDALPAVMLDGLGLIVMVFVLGEVVILTGQGQGVVPHGGFHG